MISQRNYRNLAHDQEIKFGRHTNRDFINSINIYVYFFILYNQRVVIFVDDIYE